MKDVCRYTCAPWRRPAARSTAFFVVFASDATAQRCTPTQRCELKRSPCRYTCLAKFNFHMFQSTRRTTPRPQSTREAAVVAAAAAAAMVQCFEYSPATKLAVLILACANGIRKADIPQMLVDDGHPRVSLATVYNWTRRQRATARTAREQRLDSFVAVFVERLGHNYGARQLQHACTRRARAARLEARACGEHAPRQSMGPSPASRLCGRAADARHARPRADGGRVVANRHGLQATGLWLVRRRHNRRRDALL